MLAILLRELEAADFKIVKVVKQQRPPFQFDENDLDR
jgi:hypothetical protein